MNDKAADAGRDSGEVDLRCEARSLAEHHVAVARTGAGVAGAIAALCPDDEVVEAVAVDVAGRGYRPPRLIELLLAMDDEAADSGGHIRKIDRHLLRSVSLAGLWRSLLMPAPRRLRHCRGCCRSPWAGRHPRLLVTGYRRRSSRMGGIASAYG